MPATFACLRPCQPKMLQKFRSSIVQHTRAHLENRCKHGCPYSSSVPAESVPASCELSPCPLEFSFTCGIRLESRTKSPSRLGEVFLRFTQLLASLFVKPPRGTCPGSMPGLCAWSAGRCCRKPGRDVTGHALQERGNKGQAAVLAVTVGQSVGGVAALTSPNRGPNMLRKDRPLLGPLQTTRRQQLSTVHVPGLALPRATVCGRHTQKPREQTPGKATAKARGTCGVFLTRPEPNRQAERTLWHTC